ncbi:MAG: hypothetical protein ACO39G_03945 [Flavobacteriaceae bacterium]
MRKKKCARCQLEFPVMFRVQYKRPPLWVFVCKSCLLEVKPNNPDYRYGGTWKA